MIYVPVQWVMLIRCAKVTGNPYVIKEIANEEFLDFKPIVEDKSYNWKSADEGSIIKGNQIKEFMVTFEKPFILNIKYNLSSSDFFTIN